MVIGAGQINEELIGLHESQEGLLEFSFKLRNARNIPVAIMQNNMFISKPSMYKT